MTVMSDADLLARSSRGDETAFRILYERHRDAVYRFAWVLTKSETDAEEIVQDSFLTLNRKARDFDPQRASLRTWLLGITRKLGSHRGRRPPGAERDLETPSADPGIEAALILEETADAGRRAPGPP